MDPATTVVMPVDLSPTWTLTVTPAEHIAGWHVREKHAAADAARLAVERHAHDRYRVVRANAMDRLDRQIDLWLHDRDGAAEPLSIHVVPPGGDVPSGGTGAKKIAFVEDDGAVVVVPAARRTAVRVPRESAEVVWPGPLPPPPAALR